jgi:uncharacterized membrane protein YkoI
MRNKVMISVAVAAALVGGTAIAAATQAPAAARGIALFDNAHWDDDDDAPINVRRTAMPVPDAKALKAAGMVRVTEVERDDGRIEVEGYDRHGREMDVKMDANGRRVLSVEIDDDDMPRRIR